MRGQTIGKSMTHGYAGSYSRQPDMVVDTHPLGGTEAVKFGAAVVRGSDGITVQPFGASDTANTFLGVTVRGIKSAVDYLAQNEGSYRPAEAVPVMKRGCINVMCQVGVPKAGGAVYVRTVESETYEGAAVGGFEATAESGKNVALSNAVWNGPADANGVAELRILTINKA